MERLANRILLTTGWRRAFLAVLAGAVTVLAQAPFHLFFVCFLTFPLLVWLLDGAVARPSRSLVASAWPAFSTGWWFGFGYFAAGMWWIGNALFVEAEALAWLWPFAVTLIPAVLAMFYGLAAVFARMLWSDGIGRIFALAFGFGLAEWLRSYAFTGFPWNAIGYAAMPVPELMQSASVVGLYGMNALAVLAFALPACIARTRLRAGLSMGLIALQLGGHATFGYWRLHHAPEADTDAVVVRVVQPAIDQSEKWDRARRSEIFDMLTALSEKPNGSDTRPALVVWPETSVPYVLTEAPGAVAAIAEMLGEGQILLAGAVRAGERTEGGEPTWYNSILAVNDEGVIIDAADKKHLVPFGEYLPFREIAERFGLRKIADADRGYSPASLRRTMSLPGGVVVLPSVCYEAIFPYAVASEGEPPTLIVNVTNDAWYGDTPGPYQHLHQARIRAVENGLPMVRAANNGLSAVFDAHGRQLGALGYDVRGAFEAPVASPLEMTLYRTHGWQIVSGIFSLFAAIAALARIVGAGLRSRATRKMTRFV
ncbi:apolipoprotein N-acyltransferase [Oricola thermophila]|uniref:Apolipoprotein N-acyltransferase n=1 Tax=Oricola thermophila TaxID=2742145 RepID=A0A6N1VG75_9HYPH|nr:apolipoprotein N-acyltransferase [Oricola thermophila]QKV19543.1 apolipoprotein N-acyltransferase [Oricola thermophila]